MPDENSIIAPKKKRDLRLVDGLDTRHHPLYGTWRGMKRRCYLPSNHNYQLYGGRGIRMCERWRTSFAMFVSDMGPRPSPAHTIDRKDNDGNYEPENCRWATPKEQRNNQRPKTRKHAHLLPDGYTVRAKNAGLNHGLVFNRVIKHGWDIERALSTPPEKMWDGSKSRTYPSKKRLK